MILQKTWEYISITNDIRIYSLFDNTSREGLQIEFCRPSPIYLLIYLKYSYARFTNLILMHFAFRSIIFQNNLHIVAIHLQ